MMTLTRPPGVALLLALLTVAGCGRSVSPSGRTLLLESYQADRAYEYPQVVRLTSRFLEDFGRSNRADEALYLRGVARARLMEPAPAQADLQAAFDRSRNTNLKAQAALALGELAWEADDLAQAERWYRTSLSLQDRGSPADRAYLQLGTILQRQGRWHEADIQFSRLAFFFDQPAARLAHERLQCRAWTVEAGAFEQPARAQALAAQLSAAGQAAVTVPLLRGGALLHAVHVGRYETYDQARSQLAQVARLADEARVVPTR